MSNHLGYSDCVFTHYVSIINSFLELLELLTLKFWQLNNNYLNQIPI
jgi:hypothetical protein